MRGSAGGKLIRLAVRAVEEANRIEEEGAPNTYDCRICRGLNIHRTMRHCLFDKPRALAETPEGDMVIVDTESAGCLMTPAGDPLDDLRRWRSDGHEICHVPIVPVECHEIMASEVDAKEYHLLDPDPLRAQLVAFRTVRSERAMGMIRRRGRENRERSDA